LRIIKVINVGHDARLVFGGEAQRVPRVKVLRFFYDFARLFVDLRRALNTCAVQRVHEAVHQVFTLGEHACVLVVHKPRVTVVQDTPLIGAELTHRVVRKVMVAVAIKHSLPIIFLRFRNDARP
jgi:hypothetical protein